MSHICKVKNRPRCGNTRDGNIEHHQPITIGAVYPFMVAYLPRKGKENMKIPSARKLPSGSWFIRVQVDGETISITKPTEKEAIAEAMNLKARLKEAARSGGKDQTLRQAIDAYIDTRRNVLSPATIRGYMIIRNNRFPTVMDKRLSTIRSDKWQALVNLEARSVSAKTLRNSWGFISSVLHEATGQTVTVRLPQVIPNERDFLDASQIPVFIQAIKGERVEIAALLALSSLRRSEILALTWDDVDLKNRVLRITAATVPDESGVMVRKAETKNTTSRRTVPIIDPLYAALSAVKRKSGPVVTMSTSGMYKRINALCERNGLPQVGVHGLRHSFASLAYHLQLPEKIAMQIGGWANSQTMHKIYTHVSQRDLDQAAIKFTSFFSADP